MKILSLLATSPLQALAFLFSIVIAITIHEFAHAWTADRLGDDTPSLQGRVTLNPLAHLDPLGSLMFILLGFGWGKPVIYNPMRLARRSDELLIALAGPVSNLFLATLLNIIAFTLGRYGWANTELLDLGASLNVLLAAFNMIPIPPLDGSSIIAYFWPEYRSLVGGQIGTIILLAVIFVPVFGGNTLLGALITPLEVGFTYVTHLFGLLG
jgi:Zn-dependent protease